MQWVSWHENLSATPANFRQFGQQSINQRREHKDIIVYEGQTKAGVTSCLQNQTDFSQYIIFLDTETYPLDKEESIESKWKFVVMDLWFICLQNK